MDVLRFILRLIGWLVTIIIQIAAAYFFVFLLSVIFAGVDTTSRLGWLESLFGLWLGFVAGVTLVGLAAIRWLWKLEKFLAVQRLIGACVGALIPLLVVLPIGFSVQVGDTGSSFYNLVTNYWQPVLAQASVFAAVVGFYVPSYLKTSTPAVENN